MTPEQQKSIAIAKARRARAAAETAPVKQTSAAAFDPSVMGPTMGGFQMIDDAVRGAANGLTFGLADRFAGVMGGEGTEAERAKSSAANERGNSYMVGEIGGAVAGLGKLQGAGITAGRFLPQGAGLLGKGAAGAADALVANEAINAGYGRDFGENAGLALGAGAAAPAAGKLIAKGASKAMGVFNKAPPAPPSYNDIVSQAAQKFQAADAEGVIFSNPALKNMLGDIKSDFASRSFQPVGQPGAATALKVLQQQIATGQPMTAEGLKSIRTIAGEQWAQGKKTSNDLLNMMKGRLDDFAMDGNPANVIAGNAPKAASLRKEANTLYSQQKKIETVRKAIELAEHRAARTYSGGNLENTVKQELDKILLSPKKGRGFTPDEKAAIEKVVFNQTGRDALRLAGKFNPFRSATAAALGGTVAYTNPVIGGALMLGGAAAKGLGNAIQKSKVKKIEQLIASGGKAIPATKNKAQKAIEGKEAIIARLLAAGGLAGIGAN